MHWWEMRPVRTEDDERAVVAASEADGHPAYAPTHGFWKGDKVVGWASLPVSGNGNRVALTLHWFSRSGGLSRRECFEIINVCENWCRALGYDYVIPVVGMSGGDSPFAGVIPGMGFHRLDAVPFIKKL